jgi:hypothetical protein
MSTLVGFGAFSALLEEQISEKISRRNAHDVGCAC